MKLQVACSLEIKHCEHRWTRTIDPLIKSEMLYLLSYMLDRACLKADALTNAVGLCFLRKNFEKKTLTYSENVSLKAN